jgi:chemotaxis protein MotB
MISRTTRTRLTILVAIPALLTVVGCSSVPQDEYDQALTENAELRDRLAETQSMLQQSEDDKSDLVRRTQDLSAELQRAESQTIQQPIGGGNQANLGNGGIQGAVMRPTGDVVLSVAGNVLFESGKVTLKASGRRELDRIARAIMTQYSNNTIRVEGYTDTDPIRKSTWKSNERLSSERALSVEAYLVARGLNPDRVYSAAMGSASPKSNKQASRRVEIVILAQ